MENTDKTEFVHFYIGQGRATAAIRKVADNYHHVAVSFCSPNDQFSRKKGRLIAEGRLNKGKPLCSLNVETNGDTNFRTQVVKRVLEVRDHDKLGFPQWAQ